MPPRTGTHAITVKRLRTAVVPCSSRFSCRGSSSTCTACAAYEFQGDDWRLFARGGSFRDYFQPRHRSRPGRRAPGYLLPRPGRSARRPGLLVLALGYLGLVGGLVACAVILGAPPVLATVAGLVGALLGTAVAR